jgi:hypothetical protein
VIRRVERERGIRVIRQHTLFERRIVE